MRNFSMRFYKNLMWIYICILVCFSYTVFMGEIPNQIYLSEGEEAQYRFSVPVSVTEEITRMPDASQTSRYREGK